MLKLKKAKGISLIELMVALGLGLILVFSMLTFYSVSQSNITALSKENQKQQSLRTMMNLISKDIENTGAFECAEREHDIFFDPSSVPERIIWRMPKEIIMLGNNLQRKQIMFVHPVTEEHVYRALGMIDIQNINDVSTQTANYDAIMVNAGCGQDHSPLYIGSTIFEMIPMPINPTLTPTITETLPYSNSNVTAFVALSTKQSRQEVLDPARIPNFILNGGAQVDFAHSFLEKYQRAYYSNNYRITPENTSKLPFTNSLLGGYHDSLTDPDQFNNFSYIYQPTINNGSVLFLSDNQASASQKNLPFGNNKVDIFLGFSGENRSGFVPNQTMTSLENGGWINPFENTYNYDMLVEKKGVTTPTSEAEAKAFNQIMHNKRDSAGQVMESYPLNTAAAQQVRAVKFQFTFNSENPDETFTITRTIRFTNTHLMQMDDEDEDD